MLSKIASLVGLGRVASTRDDAPVRVSQVRLSEVETRDQTPIMQEYGFSSRPHPGADTAQICLGGDRSKMIVIATHDQRYFFALVEGEVCIHDDLGQSVHITRSGIVINGGGLPMSIVNTPSVSLNATAGVSINAPSVSVQNNLIVGTGASGTFTANGGINVTVRDGIVTNIF